MKTLFTLAFIVLEALNANSQTKKDGTPDMRYNANKTTYTIPSSRSTNQTEYIPSPTNSTTTTTSTLRPAYSTPTHTESHGGVYVGETNSHHKDGKYENPNSNPVGTNVYGTHKATSTIKAKSF